MGRAKKSRKGGPARGLDKRGVCVGSAAPGNHPFEGRAGGRVPWGRRTIVPQAYISNGLGELDFICASKNKVFENSHFRKAYIYNGLGEIDFICASKNKVFENSCFRKACIYNGLGELDFICASKNKVFEKPVFLLILRLLAASKTLSLCKSNAF